MVAPLIHGLGDGTANSAFGLHRIFRVRPEDSDSRIALFEEHVPEGVGPPLHVHHDAEELFIVLEGAVLFHCDGTEAEAGPGTTVLIPRGAKHAFKGIAQGISRVLIQLTPGDGIGFFEEVEANGLTADQDLARIHEIARTHQIEFVGPPL